LAGNLRGETSRTATSLRSASKSRQAVHHRPGPEAA